MRVPLAVPVSSSGWSPNRHPGDRPDGFASLSIASPSYRVDVSSKPSRLRSAARSETLDQEPLDRGGRPTASSGWTKNHRLTVRVEGSGVLWEWTMLSTRQRGLRRIPVIQQPPANLRFVVSE